MDPNEGVGAEVSTQNLSDLQNYLVTFNKEIEGGDPSTIPVITDPDGSDPVTDMYTVGSVSQALQSGSDSTGAGHFSTAFYSEQSLLDSTLGDDTSQNIHSLVTSVDGVDSDIVAQIKQEAANMDLDDASMVAVQAQLASLTGSISDMSGSPQELIMTSVGDGLEAHEGKVIRIVSLGQDGSILSLGDGSQMQILSEEALQGIGEIKDSPVTLESLSQSTVMTDSQDILDGDSTSGITVPSTAIHSSLTSPQITAANESGDSTTLAIGTAAGALQPQLVAVTPGEDVTADALQQVIGLRSDTSETNPIMLNTANALQTVAIVPSEGENGEMNYILIVSQPDGANKVLVTQGISLDMNTVLNLKEAGELTEEMIEEDGTTKRILKIIPKKMFPETGTELMCHFCNYTSPKRYLLTRHMKSHSEDRPHKCDICHRGFKTFASLTNHVNTHTGTRPHKCKQCEAAFTTSGELVRHVRYRHTFEKPHKCPECDYASVELSKLKRHLRSHTGERPYQCPTCSYASPDTYKLKRHMRIHTGEKPYECNICHARFTQSNSLKAHKLIHSGNKPVFQCQFCPTTCGRKTDLKIHMQKLHYSDEPVTCRKCGESFPDRYNFKLHMKSHEGEKCFKCDLCDYAACSQPHLESHILTHSGVKPFKCDECDHAFRQKQLLKRHKNLHHTADYQPPTPRDKNHDCTACDKSFAHRGNLLRHMAQHESGEVSDGETSAVSGDGAQSEGGMRSVTAENILHGDLMQDWREGKLGNAPQVVIVHPDGRIEEVTPKLQVPPDRTGSESLVSVDTKAGKTVLGKSSKSVGSDKAQTSGLSNRDLSDSDDDGNQREAGTQVELETDSDEEGEDEDEDTGHHDPASGSQQVKGMLTPEQLLQDLAQSSGHSDSGGFNAVLEGSGVTLYPAGTSSDLESVIASLPLEATPVTLEQPPPPASEQGGEPATAIPTIDAPEILAHLGFTAKMIKQEKVDEDDPSASSSTNTTPITISLLPHSAALASLQQSKATTSLLTARRSQLSGSEASATSGQVMVAVPKMLTSVAAGSSAGQFIIQTKQIDRKTRHVKKKEDAEQASPAKRTRKSLAEQGYTYI